MRKLFLAAAVCASAPAFATGIDITVAGPDGEKGVVSIDLFETVAPKHVEQITELAASGAYDGVVFHRVIEGFMAQTGDVQFGNAGGEGFSMQSAGMGGSERPDLPAEFSDIPFERGIVGMARSHDPNSGNSQFFIMFAEEHRLNGQYTVVGRVTSGQEVVDQIKLGKGRNGAVLGVPDHMEQVVVTEGATE